MDRTSRDYEICACKHVTRGQVEDIIKEKEIKDLVVLCQAMDIGNKCGGCREDLDNLLTEIWGE